MSRSLSSSENMLAHSLLMMASTWLSRTFLTKGPKLCETYTQGEGIWAWLVCVLPHPPSDRQILDLSVLVLHKAQDALHDLSFAVVVELDGVVLQLRHQVIRGHEAKVLVHGGHLQGTERWWYAGTRDDTWEMGGRNIIGLPCPARRIYDREKSPLFRSLNS